MTIQGTTFADTVSTALGRKFSKLVPQPLMLPTKTPLFSPFGLSRYPGDKSARVSLDLRCTDDETLELFREIDAWAPVELAAHSERIFGKKLSLEQVQAAYRPCLRQKEGFLPLLHTKVTLDDGPNATTFWDEQKQKCDPPEDFRNVSALVKLSVPHLWISNCNSFGFVVNVVSMQLQKQQPVIVKCPF